MSIESADNILHVKNSTMRISRVEVGQTLSVGNIEFDNPTTLTSVTSNGNNTTPYTVSFSNVTTGLATTANIDVGGELTVSGNVQVGTANLFVDTVSSNVGVGTNAPMGTLDVKGVLNHTQVANVAQITSNSNVVMEYKLSTRDYETVEPRVAIDSTLSVGGYTVSASSTFNSGSTGTYGPWGAFNKLNDANGWSSDGHGSSTDTYSTSNGSQLLNVLHHAGSALGEWIQLDMPYGILLKSVDIQSRAEGARTTEEGFPKNVYLYGSTDNSTWSLIKNFTAAPKKGDRAEIHNELVSVQVEYKHFALVTNSVYVGAGNYPAVGIGEIRYYGTGDNGTANVATGTDVVLHTTPNVPKTDFSNVYYDGQDYTSMPATVADKSGNGVTGTPSGGVGFDSTYKAFTFDGVDDKITATLTNPAGAWVHSASMWFKVNALTSTHCLFSVNNDDTGDTDRTLRLELRTTGTLKYNFKNNYVIFGSDDTIRTGEWYHLSATYSGGSDAPSRKVFLNGVELGISSTGGTIAALNAHANALLKIGTRETNSGVFNGSIANFRLYNQALSADEIWELYAYQKEYFGVSPDVVTLKAGRVGIGTSEPRAVLDVMGDIRGGCPVFLNARKNSNISVPADPGSVITWDYLISYKGGGYEPSTGIFTAPLAGYYRIYIFGSTNNSVAAWIWLYLNPLPLAQDALQNANVIAMLYSGADAAQRSIGSIERILYLNVGDKIVARARGQNSNFQGERNSFSINYFSK